MDRLQADHRTVSTLLDQVESYAEGLPEPSARSSLVWALMQLSDTLLEHLAVEEATLRPVLAPWSDWSQLIRAGATGAR